MVKRKMGVRFWLMVVLFSGFSWLASALSVCIPPCSHGCTPTYSLTNFTRANVQNGFVYLSYGPDTGLQDGSSSHPYRTVNNAMASLLASNVNATILIGNGTFIVGTSINLGLYFPSIPPPYNPSKATYSYNTIRFQSQFGAASTILTCNSTLNTMFYSPAQNTAFRLPIRFEFVGITFTTCFALLVSSIDSVSVSSSVFDTINLSSFFLSDTREISVDSSLFVDFGDGITCSFCNVINVTNSNFYLRENSTDTSLNGAISNFCSDDYTRAGSDALSYCTLNIYNGTTQNISVALQAEHAILSVSQWTATNILAALSYPYYFYLEDVTASISNLYISESKNSQVFFVLITVDSVNTTATFQNVVMKDNAPFALFCVQQGAQLIVNDAVLDGNDMYYGDALFVCITGASCSVNNATITQTIDYIVDTSTNLDFGRQSSFSCSNCVIEQNLNSRAYSSFFVWKASMYIFNSTIIDNYPIPGSFFYILDSSLVINATIISGNTGEKATGFIELESADATSSVYLDHVVAEYNAALNGSLVYATQGTQITSRDGRYENNVARDSGGVFYCGGCINLTSINDFYLNNSATIGGAINLEPTFEPTSAPGMMVIGANFTRNTAQLGGAIYAYVYDQTADPVTITASSFQQNAASLQGGAVYSGNSIVPTITTSTFIGNTAALSGPDLASSPAALTWIPSVPPVIVGYSGLVIEDLNVGVLDAYGKPMTLPPSQNYYVSIAISQVSGIGSISLSSVQLSGEVQKVMIGSSVTFSNLKLYSPSIHANLTVVLSVSTLNGVTYVLDLIVVMIPCPVSSLYVEESYLSTLTICTSCQDNTVSNAAGSGCVPCAAGFERALLASKCSECAIGFFSTAGSACAVCPINTFSLAPGASSCQACFQGTVCQANGGTPIAQLSYYINVNVSAQTILVGQCPLDWCSGTLALSESGNNCAPHHVDTVPLCGGCDVDQGYYLWDFTCRLCSTSLQGGGIAALYIFMAFYASFSFFFSPGSAGTYLSNIVLFFVQVLGMISVTFKSAVQTQADTLWLSTFNLEIPFKDCPADLVGGQLPSFYVSFWFKLSHIVFLTVFICFLALLDKFFLDALRTYCAQTSVYKTVIALASQLPTQMQQLVQIDSSSIRDRMIKALIAVSALVYMPMLRTLLSATFCIDVYPASLNLNPDNFQVLAADPSISCSSSLYQSYLIFSIFFAIIFVPLPLVISFIIAKTAPASSKLQITEPIVRWAGHVVIPFNEVDDSAYWWSLFEFRKLPVVFIIVYAGIFSINLELILLSSLFSLYLIVSMALNPLTSNLVARQDILVLVLLFFACQSDQSLNTGYLFVWAALGMFVLMYCTEMMQVWESYLKGGHADTRVLGGSLLSSSIIQSYRRRSRPISGSSFLGPSDSRQSSDRKRQSLDQMNSTDPRGSFEIVQLTSIKEEEKETKT